MGFYPDMEKKKLDTTGYTATGLTARPLSYTDAWHIFNDLHGLRLAPTPVISQHQRDMLVRAVAEVLRARKAGESGAHGIEVDPEPLRAYLTCEACDGKGWDPDQVGKPCMVCGGGGTIPNPFTSLSDPFGLGDVTDPFGISAEEDTADDPFAI